MYNNNHTAQVLLSLDEDADSVVRAADHEEADNQLDDLAAMDVSPDGRSLFLLSQVCCFVLVRRQDLKLLEIEKHTR